MRCLRIPIHDVDKSRVLPILIFQAILLMCTLASVREMHSRLKMSISDEARGLQAFSGAPKTLSSYRIFRDRRECGINVGLGSDLNGERGQFALINSIISNYQDDSRVLCIFSFSTRNDYRDHVNHLECVFDNLPPNVRIIANLIEGRETWYPRIFSKNGSGREELNSDYNWFRWYLKPENVQGATKLLWLDTDMIVQGNVAELYDWNLNGNVVAAGTYDQPMRDSLCMHPKDGYNPVLHELKTTYKGVTYRPQHLPHHLNAGMLLIDLEKFQRDGILEEWSRLLQIHEDPSSQCLWKLSNQPPFTLAIRNKYEELPEVWNIGCLGCPSLLRKYKGDACNDGKLLHWNGSLKPWDENKYYNDWTKKYEEADCRSTWQQYDVMRHSKGQCMVKSII